MHGLPGDSSLVPSHSHSRLSSLVSAGSCVVRVYRGWVLLSEVFWCGAFGLSLVVVVLSVGSGAGACSPCLTWVLGVLSRWLVDPCGVVVLTVLCGLLSPFRVLCCCPCPWARAHDWLRVGFLATWGRVLGVFVGAVQGWRVGVSCWLRAVGWLGVVWVRLRPSRGAGFWGAPVG